MSDTLRGAVFGRGVDTQVHPAGTPALRLLDRGQDGAPAAERLCPRVQFAP